MNVMNQNEEYLKYLNEKGVTFYVEYEFLGLMKLNYHQAMEYAYDKHAFMAKSYNVSKELLLNWVEFFPPNPRCIGKTKTGKKCEAYAGDGNKVNHPSQCIKSNPDLYCHQHKWQAREN